MDRRKPLILQATVFLTGAAVMLVEVLGTRIIGPAFGTTLFVWAAQLTVTLLALAVGYVWGGALGDRRPHASLLGAVVATSGALVAWPSLGGYWVLDLTYDWGPRFGPLAASFALFTPALVALGAVGPVAIRLSVADVARAGRAAGGTFAASTFGGLVGTLATAFVLIPAFTTKSILLTTSGLLVAWGVVLLSSAARWWGLAALVLPAASLLSSKPEAPEGFQIVDEARSQYGFVQVIDGPQGVRYLRADHSVIGAMFVREERTAFSFTHVLESLRFVRPEAKTLLALGLGTGAALSALQKYTSLRVDAVEIDPTVVGFAKKYFGFDANGQVFVEDARTYLARSTEKYDLIVHDSFTGGTVPEHLLSVQVVRLMKERLNAGGVVALNIVGFHDGRDATLAKAVHATLREVFPVVRAFLDIPAAEVKGDISNLTFFASSDKIEIRVPTSARFESVSCERSIRSLEEREVVFPKNESPVISDEWSPVARSQLASSEKYHTEMRQLLPKEVWLQW